MKLNLHLKECLNDIQPFKMELEGFSKQINDYGNYLFISGEVNYIVISEAEEDMPAYSRRLKAQVILTLKSGTYHFWSMIL